MMLTRNKIFAAAVIVALALGASLALNNTIRPEQLAQQPPPIYEMPAEAAQPTATTLFFAGDIMLSRNVGTKITQANNPSLPYLNVIEAIRNADISFANLESPFSDTGPRVTEGLVFKAEPNTVAGLTDAGFDVLSTANNHSADQDDYGLFKTVGLLIDHGIFPLGTPNDCHAGVEIEKNGIRFGFLGYSYAGYNDGGFKPNPNVCDWNDLEQVLADVAAMKAKTDFVIVSSHMGEEYKRVPEEANVQAARATIDAGADLFIGHHPHWIQTIEEYNGKFIFYSLGNFVFDQMWSQDTREGLTAQLLFKDRILSRIEVKPVIIDNYCCPRWANDTETKTILSKINLTSPVIMDKN